MSEQLQTSLVFTEAGLADIPGIVDVHFDADISRFPAAAAANMPTADEVEEYNLVNDFIGRFKGIREREMLYQSHKDIRVAKLGTSIVGFSVYDHYAHWLDSLYVSPGHQGKGVGSVLLRNCLEMAGPHQTKLLAVAYTPSVSFYTKHGFTSDGPLPAQRCPQITPSKRLPLIGMTYTPPAR